MLQFLPGDGATVGAGADQGPARGRRGLHRFHRNRVGDQPRAGRAQRADRRADRRDRRPERDDRRLLGAARADWSRTSSPRPSSRPASAARPRACCSCRTTSPTSVIDMLAGAMDRAEGRRPGTAFHRRRPGDRRGRLKACWKTTPRAWTREAKPDRARCRWTAGGMRARHLLRAARLRDPVAVAADPRGVRAGAARDPLEGQRARRGHRRDQRHRLRPDPGHPQPHRRHRRLHQPARARRQPATSTATRSARWSACSRSAANACPAPAPRPAARTTCCASPSSDAHRQHHRRGRQCQFVDTRGLNRPRPQPEPCYPLRLNPWEMQRYGEIAAS